MELVATAAFGCIIMGVLFAMCEPTKKRNENDKR